MPWFKVDDGLATHPKVLEAGNPAMGLWVRAGAWCAQQLTDGFVSTTALRVLGTEQEAGRLVEVGLWDEVEGGWQFHQWDERQPTKGDVEERRAKNAARLRAWRERQEQKGSGVTNSVTERVSSNVRNAAPDPTRPDPSRPIGIESEDADASRPDVERLLDLLDSEIQKNGARIPKRNKANRDAIRLMLDRDCISENDIAGAIRWCQADEFWRGNILSAVKLREKYDQLRLQAARGRRAPAVQENMARLAEYEAAERADEQKGLER